MQFLKRHWKKIFGALIGLPVLLFTIALTIVYVQQAQIVQHFLEEFNADIEGYIVIEKSRVAPFKNFPYISIDLQGVRVYEDENNMIHPLLELNDVYVGFDVWKLLGGKTEVKSIALKDGHLDIVQDKNAELNIAKAFKAKRPVEEISEALHLKLKSIQLDNIDFSKLNEENQIKIDALIDRGVIGVEMNDAFTLLHANMEYTLSILKGKDSTFFKNKHGKLDTDVHLDFKSMVLDFEPSMISVEKAVFEFEGSIELDDDLSLDLKLKGSKPNFDLFLSFALEELAPALERYENAGDVYFNATIQGPSLNTQPHIEARFGCKETYVSNQFNKRKMDQLQFNAYFTNGDSNRLETSYFELKDFEARPEAGKFKGYLSLRDFSSPEIDMRVESDFNLDFLADFFELENLYKLRGQVLLTMNFHDIVDLNNPEKTLQKIDQAYYANLKINDLSFESPDFHLPVRKITVAAETKGDDLLIHKVDAKIGKSDILISGKLSNVPDLIHHAEKDIELELAFQSELIDLEDLTKSKRNPDQFIADQIKNFKTHFKFIGSAKDITEFQYLPKGRFILDELYASFKNYPHKIHDFDVDVEIDESKIYLKKFHGEIDQSDVDIYGSLTNYPMFMHAETNGDTDVEFRINSRNLVLKNLLTYNGENYLPADYRDEILNELELLGRVALHFKDSQVISTDLYLDKLQGKMKMHPLKLEQFKGRIHVENEHLMVQSLSGKMGHSQFTTYLNYYYGADPKVKKRDNYLKFSAPRLDVDELTNYHAPKAGEKIDHDSVFNIYELPFTDMRFDVDVATLNYHQYKIKNLKAKLHTTADHYLHIDQFDLDVADGHLRGKGYFDGRDAKKIYLNPDFQFSQMDLTKLMLKFDNFGQDELVANNLTGRISGKLSGKIRVHTDLVPIIDHSLVKLDFQVLNGAINSYAPFLALEDYFKDKNLHRIAFDTLQNNITIDKGMMTIPAMTINSTLGFLIVEGTQDLNLNMNYLVRIPFKMVTQAASQKLFKRKKEEIDPDKEDEIIYHDPNKKTSFVNVRITGTPDVYKVSVERKKKV